MKEKKMIEKEIILNEREKMKRKRKKMIERETILGQAVRENTDTIVNRGAGRKSI